MFNSRCDVSLIATKGHAKSTRHFRLSVAALLECLTTARLIQTTQMPLVGIVTHGPFTAAHIHPSKPTQFADSVSRQRFGAQVSKVREQCPPFQDPVSRPPELLATRVPSDQRVLMQHGASSDQRHSDCLSRQ